MPDLWTFAGATGSIPTPIRVKIIFNSATSSSYKNYTYFDNQRNTINGMYTGKMLPVPSSGDTFSMYIYDTNGNLLTQNEGFPAVRNDAPDSP